MLQKAPFFLLLLLLLLASSASSADPKSRSPHRLLFSTRSPNPWLRGAPAWIHDDSANASSRRHGTARLDGDPAAVAGDSIADEVGSQAGCEEAASALGAASSSYLDSLFAYHIWKGQQGECKGKGSEWVQAIAVGAWLLVLFYLLGTTASDYFSCALERLSEAWNLSPAVAGATLLAIGNGAPDVFSSVAAFTSSDASGSIGFSCVLGGALFITTVVSGTVALVTESMPSRSSDPKAAASSSIRFASFARDAIFLIASALVLTLVLMDGAIHLWEAASFLGIYAVYALSVWFSEVLDARCKHKLILLEPLLSQGLVEKSLMQQNDGTELEHHHHLHIHTEELETGLEYLLDGSGGDMKPKSYTISLFKSCIEWPLAVPRLLTIPVIEEERWSRPLAVASCTLAPLFVALIWVLQFGGSTGSVPMAVAIGGGLGLVLGVLAWLNTEVARPPQHFTWVWLAGGFFMSIVWFYIVADQVVACLELLGKLFGINPALLGLTVLAWGNSIADLVADLSLACSARDGIPIAVSGCYAGPLFNVVVGLGVSLVIACYRSSPEPLLFSDDDGTLLYIIGFLIVGLAWALVMVPLKGMKLSKSFGAGLLLLYCGFLVTGMCYIMGWTSPK